MYEGSALQNQSTTSRQPEVSNEMDHLSAQCEILDKQISELEQRLITVLAQRTDVEGSSAKNPEPVRVPLAQAIHDRARHLSQLGERLNSIINRIEV